ncbi:MAG: 16S rRNA (cytidine(1402)-2'-O)-methyltransferase [Alphaproteobacteria bacterium]|nr:16S rRNA (cytidine(1402)-2'-O)-methyltransferase [Alphaproteobacteria bacterium]
MQQDASTGSSDPGQGSEPSEAEPSRKLTPGLYLVATPIGNLGDVTLRALQVLRGVDVIACEDTRITRRLLERHVVATPMTPYHEHNARRVRPGLIARLSEGARIALVSDAGTPLVSDPGFKLVEAAIAAGVAVIPVPGASAALAALVVAGLPTDRFLFVGFLPPKAAARWTALAELAAVRATLVIYETGPRLGSALADMAHVLGPRPTAVARELTKLHETVVRGRLDALAVRFAEAPPRGEIVVVVGPPAEATPWDDAAIDAALDDALARLSPAAAAAEVAGLSGRPRRAIYARALARRR